MHILVYFCAQVCYIRSANNMNTSTTKTTKTETLVWVATMPSAEHPGDTCFLGAGKTKTAALEDAYGPKASWTPHIRRVMRLADVYTITEDEWHSYP